MSASLSSPFLAERLISRLSPYRQACLMKRIADRLARLPGAVHVKRINVRRRRLYAMLGRLSALAA